jgi:hypothetical protein
MSAPAAFSAHAELAEPQGVAQHSRLPPLAILLSVAGVAPFVICAVTAIRGDAANDPFSMVALLAYGAVVLSFIGAIHWGFVIEGTKEPAERLRLALGAVPGLLGWGAVLLGLAGESIIGLVVIIGALVGTAIVETRAHRIGLVPRAYLILRWCLTVTVVALLTTVLVLRLSGANVAV